MPIHQTQVITSQVITFNMYTWLFVNPTWGSKDIERTRKREGQICQTLKLGVVLKRC